MQHTHYHTTDMNRIRHWVGAEMEPALCELYIIYNSFYTMSNLFVSTGV